MRSIENTVGKNTPRKSPAIPYREYGGAVVLMLEAGDLLFFIACSARGKVRRQSSYWDSPL